MSSYAIGSMPNTGGPQQPGSGGFAGSDFSGLGKPQQPGIGQQPMGGFGGQPPAMGTPFNKPTGPQVQQPGMGQSALGGQQSSPYDMMQRFQQMQQMMPQGGQPPPPPMDRRAYNSNYRDLRQQYRQGDRQGARPQYTPYGQYLQQQQQQQQQYLQQQQQQNPMQFGQPMSQMLGGNGGMPPIGEPMDRQKQPLTQPYTPDPSQVLIRSPMQQDVQQAAMQAGQQQQQGAGMASQLAGALGGVGMAMGGSVGMAPPNPYSQQVGQEDPRMQAMRRMQMMNLGG